METGNTDEAESSVGNRSDEVTVTAETTDVDLQSKHGSQELGESFSMIKGDENRRNDESPHKAGVLSVAGNYSSKKRDSANKECHGTSYLPLEINKGSQSQPTEYEIKGKGLFVIMQITEHYYTYKREQFSKKKPLNYKPDVDKFLEIFNLNLVEKPENLILGRGVTPDFVNPSATEDEKSLMFTDFMRRVTTYSHQPSFVFFILLSHGFCDGSFLLSSKIGCKCRNENHSFKGDCVARNAEKDIIRPIQECAQFHGIPKILLLQCCRGSNHNTIKLRAKGPGDTLPADDYIPYFSDMLVFHACAQGFFSWVGYGSLFIQAFCTVAQEFKTKLNEFPEDDLEKEDFWKKYSKKYNLSPEKALDGWIEDIFLKVSSYVSNQLITEKTSNEPFDKQQPVYSSSLRHRLSFKKMIESQSFVLNSNT